MCRNQCNASQTRSFVSNSASMISIRSFIHSGNFYSSSLSSLLLRGFPDTARILCRSFTPKRHKQLRIKDLPWVSRWRIQRDSNMRHFGRKVPNQPMSGHAFVFHALTIATLFYVGFQRIGLPLCSMFYMLPPG